MIADFDIELDGLDISNQKDHFEIIANDDLDEDVKIQLHFIYACNNFDIREIEALQKTDVYFHI